MWFSKGNLYNTALIWVDDSVSEFTNVNTYICKCIYVCKFCMFVYNMICSLYIFIRRDVITVCTYLYLFVATWVHCCRTFQSLQSPMSSVGTQGGFRWIFVGGWMMLDFFSDVSSRFGRYQFYTNIESRMSLKFCLGT